MDQSEIIDHAAQAKNPMDGTPLTDVGEGHNAPPDYGKMAAERMNEEYAQFAKDVDRLLEEARAMPLEVTDDETMGVLSKLVKRMRDTASKALTYHRTEKDPYFRAGQAVDRFFFGHHERLARREKTGKAGAADILAARVDDYMQRKLAKERQARMEAERKAREEAERIERDRLAKEKAAAEALAKANRARKPENVEQHQATAATNAAAAQDFKPAEELARDKVAETTAAAAAKPSQMVGTRVSDDTKVTMKKVAYCDVTDVGALDKDTLWAFVDDDAKIAACKAWAKVTQHKRPMAGASIGFRDQTVIR